MVLGRVFACSWSIITDGCGHQSRMPLRSRMLCASTPMMTRWVQRYEQDVLQCSRHAFVIVTFAFGEFATGRSDLDERRNVCTVWSDVTLATAATSLFYAVRYRYVQNLLNRGKPMRGDEDNENRSDAKHRVSATAMTRGKCRAMGKNNTSARMKRKINDDGDAKYDIPSKEAKSVVDDVRCKGAMHKVKGV